MGRPLLVLVAALALGSLVGEQASWTSSALVLLLSAALLALALAAPSAAAAYAVGAAAFGVGVAAAGAESLAYRDAPLLAWVDQYGGREAPVHVVATAYEDARVQGDRVILVVDVERIESGEQQWDRRGRVRVQVAGSAPRDEILTGDRVGLWVVRLSRPRRFQSPGAWDGEELARREGVHAVGFCKSGRLVTFLGQGEVGVLDRRAAKLRSWARRQFRQYVLPGQEEGLLRAMTLGDRTGLDSETAEDFRIAGTYHVLAISGAQVAMLAGMVLWIASRLRLGPAITATVCSIGLTFYAIVVGGNAPVTRATVMVIAMLIGRSLELDSDLANLVGLAGAVLLVHRPFAVRDAGFQLSFVATLGILTLTRPLLARLPRRPLRLSQAIAVSIAAQLPITPLLAFHFHRLPLAAVILNLAAVPLSAAVLLAGLLVLAAAAVLPWAGPWLGDLGWISAHALRLSGSVTRLAPVIDLRTPNPTVLSVLILATSVVLLKRGKGVGLVLSALGLVALAFGSGGPAGDGRLHLTVLDVGQGDALVLRSPSGRNLLVDTGGPFGRHLDCGEIVVAPYLWSLGVRKLDAILLTHAHPDHVGGVAFLVHNFGVGEVWEGPAPQFDAIYADVTSALRDAAVPRRAIARGDHLDWDGVRLDVLGPARRRPGLVARNDDSVVLMARLGQIGFLLAGDVEANAEASLPAAGAAVLKVPHHGSRTSSTRGFLDRVAPSVAVISVGEENRFGHPHPDVLAEYRSRHVTVFRTDRDGTITVSSDGERVWVRLDGSPEQRLR